MEEVAANCDSHATIKAEPESSSPIGSPVDVISSVVATICDVLDGLVGDVVVGDFVVEDVVGTVVNSLSIVSPTSDVLGGSDEVVGIFVVEDVGTVVTDCSVVMSI